MTIRRWRGWLLVATVLPAWELFRLLPSVPDTVLPSLWAVLTRLGASILEGTIVVQLAISLGVIAAGAGIAIVAAIVAVFLSGHSRWLAELFSVAGSLFHPLPGIALLPVIILWLGVGTPAVIAVIVHSVFWPVLTNLEAGYRSVPDTWRMVARNYRISSVGYLIRIALPATLPYLLAGLRIAWARSWRALISAEMVFGAIAGAGGIGWYIFSRRVFMDTTGLFAGILLVMLIGSFVESYLFGVIERRTIIRWGMSR
ncbi:MAG: ABC transporter permease [Alkalispirochaeta sp.]